MLVPLRDSWSLILGVSGGMGVATAHTLADQGANIVGVHFDTAEGQETAAKLADELRGIGVQAHLFNLNAASAATRTEIVCRIGELSEGTGVRVFVHSLAFGTLLPFLPGPDVAETITARQLAMTVDVMAHSLVYWTQDLLAAGLLPRGAKIYGLTSAGSTRIMPSYGAVSAAKCALESHIRQLAVELAPYGVAANALRAGTTITPALLKIPNSAKYAELCRERNPHLRLTEPQDVAEAIVALSVTDSSWMTGNVISVDGGEIIVA
jgi:enoyl-[acyl-carrier protein] reductase III